MIARSPSLVSCCFFGIFALGAQPPQYVWREESSGIVTGAVSIDPFNLESALSNARLLKATEHGQFVQFVMAPPGSRLLYKPIALTDVDLAPELERFGEEMKQPRPVARLTISGKSSIFEYRGSPGNVTRRVLAGEDPLSLTVKGKRVRILRTDVELAFGPTVRAYIEALGSLDESFGLDTLAQIEAMFPKGTKITAYLRNDPWFLTGNAQDIYPFENPLQPPTQRYDSAKTQLCMESGASRSCSRPPR